MSAANSNSAVPVIVWFRQDLRLADNPALHYAADADRPVIPVYILDDETPGHWAMGSASRWWLHHSLKELGKALRGAGTPLVLRRGKAADLLPKLIEETGADRVVWNRCYEPYARERDEKIKSALNDAGVQVNSFNGGLLVEPWTVATKAGDPFRVFTPFWREARQHLGRVDPLPAPQSLSAPETAIASDHLADWGLLPTKPDWAAGFEPVWIPGEDGARDAAGDFIDSRINSYADDRDRPDRDGTSRLSPHLHFGEISPRQIWSAVSHACDGVGRKDPQKYLSEIGWREFSHNLLFHFPDFPEANHQDKFNSFRWQNDDQRFKAWSKGQTGYPFVDAGMRQLWQTGWMHNRVRMVAASFLVKHLLIDWRKGQDWFWDTLVDADLANNSAGWQWVAGTGADAAPYFRIFNPFTQGEKFDPDGEYVREFVPELAALPAKWIHRPWEAPDSVLDEAGVRLGTDYPKPIVDHSAARERALAAFKDLKSAA
ncbi:cryptochrome/photolyase family protein [Hyphobacterium marinum]|uniref:Deoxyribodipyrimidine photo-lyase n=1 Tax=Hyphobacterium marinum TaxID=3116574 RepID=A0ABU7LZM1_9PROT|nr:deoxyribodipyrimidine photo-lyase [Hyphobacterium sp. Y6023]MEE2566635.1 deoxyribodipyrimidine photo-lyase [Hyphobacterium sp. Y6023]